MENLINELLEEIKNLNVTMKKFNKEVFNAYEGAEYLCVSYDTILREARLGRISYSKNGASYLFTKENLDEWLEKNKVRLVR